MKRPQTPGLLLLALAFLAAAIATAAIPLVKSSTTVLVPMLAVPLSAPRRIPHPAGISCFEKAQPVAEDGAGRLFVTCQAKNQRGQVVWFVDDTGAHSVFIGGAAYAGPGDLTILRSGQLALSTVGALGSNTTWLVPIPEWVP